MSKHSVLINLIEVLHELPHELSRQTIGDKASIQLIHNLEDFLSEESMALLIPDREREQREDFIWCLPVERRKWERWYDLSMTFKTITPDGVRYMNRMEGKKVRTILIMPNASQTDDDAMVACAWLRMVKQLDCRMYVIRCTDDTPTCSQRMLQVIGTDPALLDEVDDGNPSNAQDNAKS